MNKLANTLKGKIDRAEMDAVQTPQQRKMAGNAVFATAFKDALKRRLKAGAMGENSVNPRLDMSNMMVLDAIGEAEILLKDAGYDVDFNNAWDIAGQVIAKIPQP